MNVGHPNSLIGPGALEAVVFSKIVLEVLPDLPDDWVREELLNESSIIIREDVSEDEDTFLAKGIVELSAGRHVKLVFLLGLSDPLCRVEEQDKGPGLEVCGLFEFKVFDDK